MYHVTALPNSTHLSLAYGLTRRHGLSQSDSFSQKLKPEAGNASPRNKKPKHAKCPERTRGSGQDLRPPASNPEPPVSSSPVQARLVWHLLLPSTRAALSKSTCNASTNPIPWAGLNVSLFLEQPSGVSPLKTVSLILWQEMKFRWGLRRYKGNNVPSAYYVPGRVLGDLPHKRSDSVLTAALPPRHSHRPISQMRRQLLRDQLSLSPLSLGGLLVRSSFDTSCSEKGKITVRRN